MTGMAFPVSESGSGFKQVEAGVYPGRCVRVIGIGTQHGEYAGKPTTRVQVIVSWELPTELIAEGDYAGQPYMVSKFYTASLGEKSNLRKDLASWRGRDFTPEELKGFDLKNILTKPCMVSVIHNDKGKAKVNGIMALPKGMAVPEQINPTVLFNVFQWDDAVFDSLTDGIKDLIRKSDEYQMMNCGLSVKDNNAVGGQMPGEGEIPF